MRLLLPAAGRSSRFPDVRPKWMLTHPNGNLVIAEAIRHLNLSDVSSIYLIILKEHADKYDCMDGIEIAFDEINAREKLNVVVLDKATRNPCETIATALEIEQIDGPIFVKDCDNSFRCEMAPSNSVAVCNLNDMDLINAANKSYVTLNDHGVINNIVEKEIISPLFCVGGYSFKDSRQFLETYNRLQHHDSLYVSHIIYDMLLNNHLFRPTYVTGYTDWGTLKDWNRYRDEYSTVFVDLDGVLVENSGEHFKPLWGTTKGIKENIEIMNRLFDSGKVRIVITTSRKHKYSNITEQQLEQEGIKYHSIIYDLAHSRRIIVNDYSKTNPYKSCDAINIKRNSSDLKDMLEESMSISLDP